MLKCSPLNSSLIILLLLTSITPAGLAQKTPEPFSCSRAIPKSIVKQSVFPNSSFVLKQLDSNGNNIPVGIETVRFANGNKLMIENGGCENFTLVFRFETDFQGAKLTERRYWFKRVVKLMRQIEPGLKPPTIIPQGIQALAAYIAKNQDLQLDREIDYGGSDIRSIVMIRKIERRSDRKVLLEISFTNGPL